MESGETTIKEKTLRFKVLVVGEPGVGKTSLVARYTLNKFSGNYKTTIGVDFATKKVRWDDHTIIELQLWDLAGQDRLSSQTRTYYRGTEGVICVCDITRMESKQEALRWKEGVEERAVDSQNEPIMPPCALIVNKMDLYGNTCSQPTSIFPSTLPIPTTDPTSTPDLTLDPLCNNNNLEDGILIDMEDALQPKSKDPDVGQWCRSVARSTLDMATEAGFITGIPVSVAHNIGVDTVFKCLITEMIHRRLRKKDQEHDSRDFGIIDLGSSASPVVTPLPASRCSYC